MNQRRPAGGQPGRRGVDIAALRDFIDVVDAGSLNRAAATIGVSQPALSQRMSQIEAEMSARLLERGPRGIEPTALGLELYRAARHLVSQFDQLTDTVADDGVGIRGDVSVGLPATVAGTLVPALLPLLRERHPGIRVEFFESMSGYIHELIGRGRLDLAVLFRDDDRPRAGETVVYSERLFWVSSAEVDDSEEPVRVQDLAGRPLVSPGARSNLRDLVERAFATHDLVPNVIADVASLPAMVGVARSGEASTVMPRHSVEAYAGSPLALRPIVEPTLERWAAVCVAPEFYEPRAAVVAVRDAIVDVVRRLVERDAWPGIDLHHEQGRTR